MFLFQVFNSHASRRDPAGGRWEGGSAGRSGHCCSGYQHSICAVARCGGLVVALRCFTTQLPSQPDPARHQPRRHPRLPAQSGMLSRPVTSVEPNNLGLLVLGICRRTLTSQQTFSTEIVFNWKENLNLDTTEIIAPRIAVACFCSEYGGRKGERGLGGGTGSIIN